MDKDFWHRRWQNNEIGFHLTDPHPFLQKFFPLLQTQPTDTIFVPLCGKSPDLVWLREAGLKVVGIELSQTAVEAFFAENDLPGQWTHKTLSLFARQKVTSSTAAISSTCPQLTLSGISAYYDRGALVALPPEMRIRYAAHLSALIPPAGRILLIGYSYDQSETKGPPFSVSQQELGELFAENFRVEPLAEEDALWSHQGLAARGVTQLTEYAVLLTRK